MRRDNNNPTLVLNTIVRWYYVGHAAKEQLQIKANLAQVVVHFRSEIR